MSRQRQSTTAERKNKHAHRGHSARSKSKNARRARSTTAPASGLGDVEDAVVDGYRQILSGIVNTMNDGVIVVDRNLKVVAMNRAAQLITGYDSVDGLTRACAEICRSNRCGVACPMADAFTSGEEPPEVEMQILTKHNEMRTVRARVRLLRDSNDEIIGGMEIIRDVTARRIPRLRIAARESFGALIGKSRAMQQLYQLIEDISDSTATVLIYGETGTGKELVAHAIHENSPRCNGPFVKVNCGAIPETLLEAELFGYVRGAFTDAVTDKPGRFELAHGGTIFLDEIGEISPAVQVKLLRVLQEREFERLGGIQTIKVDVRVIAATNRNLREAVQNGQFREDLYYRLNVIPIYIPPLRERREDIPLLVEHFAEKFRNETKRPIDGISPEAMAIFIEYDWPGNVRELENALEYAFVVCKAGYIEPHHLPIHIQQAAAEKGFKIDTDEHIEVEVNNCDESERDKLLALLEANDWDLDKCARALRVHRTTLWRKMKKCGIERTPRASK